MKQNTHRKPEIMSRNSGYAKWKNLKLTLEYLKQECTQSLAERFQEALDYSFSSTSVLFNDPTNGVLQNLKHSFKKQQWEGVSSSLGKQEMVLLRNIFGLPSVERLKNTAQLQRILENFNPALVNPPTVYYKNGQYILLDGEHTAICLWLIAMALGADFNTATIPVRVIQEPASGEARTLFLLIQTSNTPLDDFDTYRINVYKALELEAALAPASASALATLSKTLQHHLDVQRLVAKYNLYFTWGGGNKPKVSKDINDRNGPGALPRFLEWLGGGENGSGRHTLKGMELFCRYFHLSEINQIRNITSIEQDLLMDFFDDAAKEGIVYTDTELLKMYAWMNDAFEANFELNTTFPNAVKLSYEKWYAALGEMKYFVSNYDAVGAEFLRCCLEEKGFRVGKGTHLNGKKGTYTPKLQVIKAFIKLGEERRALNAAECQKAA